MEICAICNAHNLLGDWYSIENCALLDHKMLEARECLTCMNDIFLAIHICIHTYIYISHIKMLTGLETNMIIEQKVEKYNKIIANN